MTIQTTSVTQTANILLGTPERTLYYLVLDNGTQTLVINVGKKTHDKVKQMNESIQPKQTKTLK